MHPWEHCGYSKRVVCWNAMFSCYTEIHVAFDSYLAWNLPLLCINFTQLCIASKIIDIDFLFDCIINV